MKFEVPVWCRDAPLFSCAQAHENEGVRKSRFSITVSKKTVEGIFRTPLKVNLLPVECWQWVKVHAGEKTQRTGVKKNVSAALKLRTNPIASSMAKR